MDWVRLLIVLTVAIASTLGSAHVGSSSTTLDPFQATSRTSLHLYAPFDGGSVAPGIRVARSVRGYCWTSSIGDERSDAYRCFVGNVIHDPCFANSLGSSSFVLCPLYYPGSKVLRIDLTKPLPQNQAVGDPTRSLPWVVQLANGRWCGRVQGASGLVAGLPLTYGCSPKGVLIGFPHRTNPLWTIFFANGFQSTQYVADPIKAAWW